MTAIVLLVLSCAVGGLFLYMKPSLGRAPDGERLARIESSPNYRDGVFHNTLPTTTLTEDKNFIVSMAEFLFGGSDRQKPRAPLPAKPIDFAALPADKDAVIWMGHSTLYLQMSGAKILVDPVFSAYAAPLPFMNRAFASTNTYGAQDIPALDAVLITHDHWDHLDRPSILALKEKAGRFICPLGVGAHLAYWGIPADKIIETDWNDAYDLTPALRIHTLEARHFSGRLLNRNMTLWGSFLLERDGRRVFISGDTGYGPHFAEIGARFPGINLAIVENGQYNEDWATIHLMPHELFKAAEDLAAKKMITVHNGKFDLSQHAWDDPYEEALAHAEDSPVTLLTPMMGEVVLPDDEQIFSYWWREID